MATLLHWSKFSTGTGPFIAWFLSYLLPPPIFLGFYFLQQRRARNPCLNKYLRYAIIEDLDTVRHVRLGQFWGVRVSVTPVVWLFPVVFGGLRLALNALGSELTLAENAREAVVFALAVAIGTGVHALGHIAGGKLVRSPMDELLFTATRGVNLYSGDQAAVPGYVHLGRALGGPVLNLIGAGLLLWLVRLSPAGFGTDVLASAVSVNRFMGFGGFLPLPSVDGQVIWREVLRRRPRRRPRQARARLYPRATRRLTNATFFGRAATIWHDVDHDRKR